MGNMDRRDFLKCAAIGASGTAAAVALASCGTKPSTEASSQAYPVGLSAEDFENSSVVVEPITQFDEEHSYDVVVVGAGTSGMPAALTALEEGASVALLQKEPTPIAQGAMSSGIILSESSDLGLLGFIQTYREICGYRVNSELLKTYVYHSGETAMWMAKTSSEAGYAPRVMQTSSREYLDGQQILIAQNLFGAKPENNQDLCVALAEWGSSKGLDIFYSTPAVQLVQEEDRITGVVGAIDGGGYAKFNASKGIILATGDYQNNESLMEKWSPDIARFSKKQNNKTGDGILMSTLVGGHVCPVNHSRQMHDNDSCRMNEEPFLAVDMQGERFMNEDVPMASWVCALVDHNQEGDPGKFCQIFDDNFYETVIEWGGSPVDRDRIMNYVPGALEDPYDVNLDLIDTHYADTLDELAEMLGIPADALIKSVTRYNELCEKKADEDFGKDAKYMQPIAKAPFWGIRRWVRVTATCNGIAVDGNYQVIDENNNPIPGLYAVGFGAGNLCGGIDWSTYISGMSCGSCMTSGRIAALHAIKGSLEPSNPITWDDVKDLYKIQ